MLKYILQLHIISRKQGSEVQMEKMHKQKQEEEINDRYTNTYMYGCNIDSHSLVVMHPLITW